MKALNKPGILAIAAVLIASVIVASAISMVFAQSGPAWQIVNLVVSAAVFSLAFMLMFKVLLVWMFYSAIVVFVGAELTHAYVSCCGKAVTPDRHAELTEEATEVAREQEEMVHAHAD